jgi:hypothetical protein
MGDASTGYDIRLTSLAKPSWHGSWPSVLFLLRLVPSQNWEKPAKDPSVAVSFSYLNIVTSVLYNFAD